MEFIIRNWPWILLAIIGAAALIATAIHDYRSKRTCQRCGAHNVVKLDAVDEECRTCGAYYRYGQYEGNLRTGC